MPPEVRAEFSLLISEKLYRQRVRELFGNLGDPPLIELIAARLFEKSRLPPHSLERMSPAERLLYLGMVKPEQPESAKKEVVDPEREIPHWDADQSELSYRGLVVRRLRPIAKGPRNILSAFEEEGWPARIDVGELTRAVRTLNEKLTPLRFERDGSGDGVRWRTT